MAQLVERYVRNVQATSSNLVISTIKNNGHIARFFYASGARANLSPEERRSK